MKRMLVGALGALGLIALLATGCWVLSNNAQKALAKGLVKTALGGEVIYAPKNYGVPFALDFLIVAEEGSDEEGLHFRIVFRGRDYGEVVKKPGDSYVYPSHDPLLIYVQEAGFKKDGEFLGATLLVPPGQLP